MASPVMHGTLPINTNIGTSYYNPKSTVFVYILNNGCAIQCKAWSCDFLLIRCISTISRGKFIVTKKKALTTILFFLSISP